MLNVTQERSLVDSYELTFDCKACESQCVTDVFQFKTTEKLLGFVPVNVSNETVVKCLCCDATFRTSTSVAELKQLSDEQASQRFNLRVLFPDKFLVVAGWTLILFAPVSFILFVIALFRIPKASKGWRKSSIIGASLSGVVSGLIFLAMALE